MRDLADKLVTSALQTVSQQDTYHALCLPDSLLGLFNNVIGGVTRPADDDGSLRSNGHGVRGEESD